LPPCRYRVGLVTGFGSFGYVGSSPGGEELGEPVGAGFDGGIGVGDMIGSGIGVAVGEVASMLTIFVDAFVATMADISIRPRPEENVIFLNM